MKDHFIRSRRRILPLPVVLVVFVAFLNANIAVWKSSSLSLTESSLKRKFDISNTDESGEYFVNDKLFLPDEQASLEQNDSAGNKSHRGDLLYALSPDFAAFGADRIWNKLLSNAADTKKLVFEVGMHRPKQCLRAARLGFEAHCFEPSPSSFEVITKSLENVYVTEPHLRDRIHLYNKAVGATSGETVQFTAGGSTGDHVGSFDTWKLQESSSAKTIEVETIRLDNVVSKEGEVYAMKIDTQGFEPAVLEGLSNSVRNHAVQFILIEYWPKGIDTLMNTRGMCAATKMLEPLVDAGYRLFALSVEAHPLAGKEWKQGIKDRPFHSLESHCQWLLQLEQRYPNPGYHMGYWTDILAVAPGAEVPISNVTTKAAKR